MNGKFALINTKIMFESILSEPFMYENTIVMIKR